MNKLLSIQEVANILGVSGKTLRRWEEKRILVPLRTSGNQRRYMRDQIDNFRQQRGDLPQASSFRFPEITPPQLFSESPEQKEVEKTSPEHTQKSAQYWTEETVKSILVFKKLAVSAVFVMLFVAVAGVGVATLKSANLLSIASLPKILSILGISKNKLQAPELSEVLRGKAVLGAGTQGNNLIFGVNVQSEFADSAQFLNTIKVARIATLSGGVITEDQDVNAGAGKLTASNVLYGAIAGDGIAVGPGQTPTITNTAVLSLTAGSGISVGTGTKPTVSNTGVLSLGGSTGALTLAAGTGISVSGLTITNSDTGSSQNIFKTIKSDSTSIAASSNTDTLTFASGTGITLTPDTTNKKITIAGSATGADFQENNGALSPVNITDDLLLGGISTSTAKFAFVNVAGGTPTASISASSGNNATFLTGTGNLQTTNRQTLTLGGGDTGDVNFSIGASNNLRISGTAGSTVASASCITSTNGIVTGSGSCPVSSNWDVVNGVITPKLTSTLDFLLGSQSTSSAEFAVTGINDGTPVATISATTNGNGISLTGSTATLQSLRMNTLTLGGASTGNIVIDSGSSLITLSDNTDLANNLLLNIGNAGTDFTSGGGLTLAGTLTANGVVALGDGGDNFSIASNALDVSTAGVISGATGLSSSGTITFSGLTASSGVYTDSSSNLTSIPPTGGVLGYWQRASGALAPANITDDLLLGATSTASAKFAVLNVLTGTPTASVSAQDAAASALVLGGDSTIQSVKNQTLTIGGGTTGNIVLSPNNGTGGLVTVNAPITATTFNKVTLTTPATGSTLTIADGKTLTVAESTALNAHSIGFGGTSPTETLTLTNGKNVIFADVFITSGAFSLTLTTTAATNVTLPTTGTLITNTASANQTITSTQTSGTILGITDSTNLAGAIVGQSITLSGTGVQDQTGLQFALSGATGTNLNDILGSGSTWKVSTTGNATFANLTPSGTTGTFGWFQRNNQALSPTNITDDLLLGGIATTSAKIAFINIAGSLTPTASLSATTTGLVLAADGTIQSIRKANLTLGGSTTGGINFTPGNIQTMFLSSIGRIGMGTVTNPIGLLNISGDAGNNATLILNNTGVSTSDLLTASASGTTKFLITNKGFIGILDGNYSTAVGYQALNSNLGDANTALGYRALFSNSTGSSNTAVGYWALFSNSTGSSNTAVGYGALNGNITGSSNTAVGYGALNTNYSANNNTALGYGALFSNSTGSSNTALGYQALYNTGSGFLTSHNNTAVGYQAGYTNSGQYSNREGDNNVYLGYNAGPWTLNASFNNSAAIGAYALVNASNSLVLGGTAFYAVNVGIGTATPSAALDIQGGQRGGNSALIVNQTGASTNDIFTASASGTTRFRMANNGSILLQGPTIAASDSGTLTNDGSPAFTNALADQGSLIPNASFESNILGGFADGWIQTATRSATITNDTTVQAHGTSSMKVVLQSNSNTAIYSACVPLSGVVNQASKYSFSYYLKGSAAGITVRAYIDQYTSQANCQNNTSPTVSAPLGTPDIISSDWMTSGAWGFGALTLSSTTTWGRAHFYIASSGTPSVWIDGIRLDSYHLIAGLDYAENYPADPSNLAEPGDVVSLTSLNGVAQVAPTGKYMDWGTIGVVSTTPGYVLDDGQMPEPKVPVALAGRVPVKVASKNGHIYIGDYLASSDIPGVAVRAITAGSVIGTAMENYTDPDPTKVGKVVMFIKNSYLPFAPIILAEDGNLSSLGYPISSEAAALSLGLQGAPSTDYSPQTTADNQQTATATQSAAVGSSLLAESEIKNLKNRMASVEAQVEDLRNLIVNSSSQSAFLQSILAASDAAPASDSADFVNNLSNLDIASATISGDLMVLGRTTTTDLGVTGNVSVGLMSIHGLDSSLNNGNGGASINSVGDLNLQNNQLGGINILAGKVTIDTSGNIKTEGEIIAKKIEANNYTVLGQESIGSGTIPAGATSVEISASVASESSKIFLTATSLTDKQITVIRKSDGKFKVGIPASTTSPISFDWWIVGNK